MKKKLSSVGIANKKKEFNFEGWGTLGKIEKDSKYYWPKLALIILFVNIVFVFIFQALLMSKIYIAGIYIVPQIIAKAAFGHMDSWGGLSPQGLIFFIGTAFVNFPLVVFAYYKVSKKYAIRSLLSVSLFLVIGIISTINQINDWIEKVVEGIVKKEAHNNFNNVSYFVFALVSGIIIGFFASFIWKNDVSGGGLDFIYTYLAIQKKKNIAGVAFKINFLSVVLGIAVSAGLDSQSFGSNFSEILKSYLLAGTASFILSKTIVETIDRLYPKYSLVKVFAITSKKLNVAARIKETKSFGRGGLIMDGKGFHLGEEKVVIVTTMSFLEINKFKKLIQKNDPKAFIILTKISGIEGSFDYFLR